MNEKKALFIINILKNIINVYFDTFFVLYFFEVANYEVIPLAKYYLTLYFFISIGFYIIRNVMKKNIKVPYLRIGISLQALYIALIMLLKENIINYIFLVGFIKGIADGFYHFPKNIINTEKVNNEDRQKFNGLTNTINQISSIVIPLILGVLLTYMSYINVSKIFFILFIIIFIVSFWMDDHNHFDKKFSHKDFKKLLKENKDIRRSLWLPFLSGFTYSSGVMGTIVTLSKINNFKTNLNLGFVDSSCAALSLLICMLYTVKIKKESFKTLSVLSGIISFLALIILAFWGNIIALIVYLFVRNSLILIINLLTDQTVEDLTNCQELKDNYKPEYYFTREVLLGVSRCIGFILLLSVSMFWDMSKINYILIIPAISIFIESITIGRLSKNICYKYKSK